MSRDKDLQRPFHSGAFVAANPS